jgi:hypothetical protein
MIQRRRVGPCAVLVGAALAAILAVPGQAQTGPIRRTLGVHTFLPSSLLGDPFTGTYVRNITGGGSALGLQVPKLDLSEQVLGYQDADISFLTVGMEYQQAVATWLAFRIGFTGGARLGTSTVALLAEGVTATAGATLGATVKLVRTDRFILSAIADVLPGMAYQISLIDFAKDVIANGLDSTSSLLSKSSPYRYHFGGIGAYTVAPWLGLQATGTVGPVRSSSGEEDTELRLGVGASMDFDSTGPPIGVLLGYLYTDPAAGGAGDNATGDAGIFNVGVFYTGHKRLVVGLDTQFTSTDQTHGDEKLNVATGRIILRYDFQ